MERKAKNPFWPYYYVRLYKSGENMSQFLLGKETSRHQAECGNRLKPRPPTTQPPLHGALAWAVLPDLAKLHMGKKNKWRMHPNTCVTPSSIRKIFFFLKPEQTDFLYFRPRRLFQPSSGRPACSPGVGFFFFGLASLAAPSAAPLTTWPFHLVRNYNFVLEC